MRPQRKASGHCGFRFSLVGWGSSHRSLIEQAVETARLRLDTRSEKSVGDGL
jgi:hypothetical protein